MNAAARVYLRAPARSDREEFTELMRVSRAFHSPWATAPTDDERFAAYLADARRADFEAMLLCRSEDDAIIGFFNLSQIVRRRLQSAYLGYAVGQPFAGHGYMREGIELVLRQAFTGAPAAPHRGQHPARQRQLDGAGPRRRASAARASPRGT